MNDAEMNDAEFLRWSSLMANLEAVVHAAHAMKRAGDITEEQYQLFNNAIGSLEIRAGDL
jgi:hypothetical protein|tara:strand:+ start:142 stop:321 length:180 start_codon:yes stop_codon:yes gene_type:complete